MSSFKRKVSSKQVALPLGTRISPSSPATTITSTGIPSFDDILGGGLPLSCTSLTLAPDQHSAYGELVQKYFIAQGLASGQRICVVDEFAKEFVKDSMWMPNTASPVPPSPKEMERDEEEEEAAGGVEKSIKIAWRYEQMKQFQTTVPRISEEDYCRTFDLTCQLPASIVDSATAESTMTFLTTKLADGSTSLVESTISAITDLLHKDVQGQSSTPIPRRICVPALGSCQWGDMTSHDICRFLHALRRLLRRYNHACASLSLAPHLCADAWGGPGWVNKLGWLSDACISMSAFTADPSLSELFPNHHGLLRIHNLPAPHTILSPSDKHSTLRGVSSSVSSAGGGGENNLAFRCMRKRLVFETLHLDVEGGVGERRTTRSTNSVLLEAVSPKEHHHHDHSESGHIGEPTVQVQLESVAPVTVNLAEGVEGNASVKKPTKVKKKVGFRSDKPDLYDF
ncbi:hypothetical protein JAAARDRAFT_170039 [Jaapia argillacea MUCL 33604]|uniref:Elongator complex protein 4 n=1 Tax=Jaapia argillacea MUCL 33604 TaxID=933084 RepID=A0A067QA22_9AGAM|nr:hypothetical protein JAAARDRAFT_170039 [Jaapia argillacea MUCL 33604]